MTCECDMQMAREMDEILRQQIAQAANSCNSENGVSFLDQVIFPLYDIVAAVSFAVFYEYFLKLYKPEKLRCENAVQIATR